MRIGWESKTFPVGENQKIFLLKTVYLLQESFKWRVFEAKQGKLNAKLSTFPLANKNISSCPLLVPRFNNPCFVASPILPNFCCYCCGAEHPRPSVDQRASPAGGVTPALGCVYHSRLPTLPPRKECCISYAPNGETKWLLYLDKVTVLMLTFYHVTWTIQEHLPCQVPVCGGQASILTNRSFLEDKANTTWQNLYCWENTCKPHQFNLLFTGHGLATVSSSPQWVRSLKY